MLMTIEFLKESADIISKGFIYQAAHISIFRIYLQKKGFAHIADAGRFKQCMF